MNKKQVEKIIEKLRKEKNCAQATALGICKNANIEVNLDEVDNLTRVFGGGIGGTFDEGTCGAVTGCMIALGFIEDNLKKRQKIAKKVFESFKEKYSTVTCEKISKNKEDENQCVTCCVHVGKVVSDLLE